MKGDGENVIVTKSKQFAIRIIRLYQFLNNSKHEYVISKQLLRSGTSIGANISEATCAFSKKDFLSKMYIAFKECAETSYWLELLHETDYLNESQFQSIYNDCLSLKSLLSSIARASSALHSVCAAIDFIDCWLHLSIARASSALHSVCAAIPNS